MTAKKWLFIMSILLVNSCATGAGQLAALSSQQQVIAAEQAFAATMQARDFDAFSRWIDDQAIFFNGPQALRGKPAVLAWWARYFEGEQAPFSWQPDQVEVLASADLALSTGLVYDPAGVAVGRFNSIWRRNAAGQWLVVFDKGSPLDPGANP